MPLRAPCLYKVLTHSSLPTDKRPRNAFRSDDPDAVIPQHDFRQGPDFRAGFVENSGYALVG